MQRAVYRPITTQYYMAYSIPDIGKTACRLWRTATACAASQLGAEGLLNMHDARHAVGFVNMQAVQPATPVARTIHEYLTGSPLATT